MLEGLQVLDGLIGLREHQAELITPRIGLTMTLLYIWVAQAVIGLGHLVLCYELEGELDDTHTTLNPTINLAHLGDVVHLEEDLELRNILDDVLGVERPCLHWVATANLLEQTAL